MLHVVHGGPSWHGPHLHLGIISQSFTWVVTCLFFLNKLPMDQETRETCQSYEKKWDPTPSSVKGAPFAPQPDFQETETSNFVTKLYPKKKSHSKKLSIHTAIVCQTAWNDLQRLSNCSVGVPGFRLPGTLRSCLGLVHLCPPGALATAFNAFGLLLPRKFRRRGEETMM